MKTIKASMMSVATALITFSMIVVYNMLMSGEYNVSKLLVAIVGFIMGFAVMYGKYLYSENKLASDILNGIEIEVIDKIDDAVGEVQSDDSDIYIDEQPDESDDTEDEVEFDEEDSEEHSDEESE